MLQVHVLLKIESIREIDFCITRTFVKKTLNGVKFLFKKQSYVNDSKTS